MQLEIAPLASAASQTATTGGGTAVGFIPKLHQTTLRGKASAVEHVGSFSFFMIRA